MAAHRIPLQDFRNFFVDRKDPESRQDTSEKIKAALIKGYSVINFPGRHIFYQPQSSLISARLQWPRRLKQL
jgi:surfactin synthase thioesterase subunit